MVAVLVPKLPERMATYFTAGTLRNTKDRNSCVPGSGWFGGCFGVV